MRSGGGNEFMKRSASVNQPAGTFKSFNSNANLLSDRKFSNCQVDQQMQTFDLQSEQHFTLTSPIKG